MTFFTELEQIILKFVWNHKRTPIAKASLRKNKSRGISLSDFRLYCKAMAIKWQDAGTKKDPQINGIDQRELRNKPMHMKSINLQKKKKEKRNTMWKRQKDSLFNNWCWETRQLHVKK